ncbi:hypothetical protein [Halorhodospira neutriphila]|nr:hypothetical protein [Halorhodospira neutriphila]
MTDKTVDTLGRLAQTVAVSLIVMALGWVGTAVTTAGEEIVRLQSEVQNLSEKLEQIDGVQAKIQRLETRVGILEDRSDRSDGEGG